MIAFESRDEAHVWAMACAAVGSADSLAPTMFADRVLAAYRERMVNLLAREEQEANARLRRPLRRDAPPAPARRVRLGAGEVIRFDRVGSDEPRDAEPSADEDTASRIRAELVEQINAGKAGARRASRLRDAVIEATGLDKPHDSPTDSELEDAVYVLSKHVRAIVEATRGEKIDALVRAARNLAEVFA